MEDDPAQCAIDRDAVTLQIRQGTQWQEALSLARAIPMAWYRTQALASVAGVADDSHVDEILDEGVEASLHGENAYRQTAVLTWLVQAAARRKHAAKAVEIIDLLLLRCESVTPPSSFASALLLLLERSHELHDADIRRVLTRFLRAADQVGEGAPGWQKRSKWFVRTARSLMQTIRPSIAAEFFPT